MSGGFDLVLRRVQLPSGAIADVGVAAGRFAAIAPALPRTDNDVDGRGRRLIAGLHDHHLHLFATAAQMESVDLALCQKEDAIVIALRGKASNIAAGAWLRATGYDERVAGIPDRHRLDQWLPTHPLRLQDRTGALWLLNSAALAYIGPRPWPDCVEVDGTGAATGRIWRGDSWLREQLGGQAPSLEPLSRQLAGWGVTAVTDAGAHNGAPEASLFAAAIANGTLRQRLVLMGREDLPAGSAYQMGPVKLLFDERDLPAAESISARIRAARLLGRAVAAHCVTEGELVTYLAALEQAGGAQPGDRIEHGSMIPGSFLAEIAARGLIVVANPGFVASRGDRYRAQMDAQDLPSLQRLASLADAGIALRAGSDAPYGPVNPWAVLRAAMLRQTHSGAVLGAEEALGSDAALALFTGSARIAEGAEADCCLIDADWAQPLRDTPPGADLANPVQLTIIGGKFV